MIANLICYWFKCRRKALYKQLGKEFAVSGFYVYRLAHGKATRCNVDHEILGKLVEAGVIKGINPY